MWQPTPVFLPEEFHGQRSLAGYSPMGCKELAMTERAHAHTSLTILEVRSLKSSVSRALRSLKSLGNDCLSSSQLRVVAGNSLGFLHCSNLRLHHHMMFFSL